MLHKISPERILAVYREMNLPEPFAYAHWEQDELQGLVTGHIKTLDVDQYLDVDFMVVLPGTKRKFHTMMTMSEDATQAAFAQGCRFIVLNILDSNPRGEALAKWANRCGFHLYRHYNDADWFVRYRPAEKDNHGQEAEPSEAAAAPDAS